MSFQLLQKSVTLNDLERHNSPKVHVISPNSVAFRAHYVKVVEDTQKLPAVFNFLYLTSWCRLHTYQ